MSLNSLAVFLLLFYVAGLTQASPWAALWTTPCIIIASMLIAWGAESAQFFVAQGFALAILAWMQTLPEFAVEAVLAWKQQSPLLLANLTGALRLLTGLAWPMIYLTAAVMHRRRTKQPMRKIQLRAHHSVEVVALILPLLYSLFIWWKAELHLYDAVVLIVIYVAYLVLLTKLPPEEHEGIEDLEAVPRAIVMAPRMRRNLLIAGLFLGGGTLIYFTAEPFLGSLVAVAAAFGIPSFVVIQWLAPVISEFPELASTFYFARQEEKAAVALMNIVSSNINQWTLLVAMLPVVFSMSRGTPSGITFDPQQRSELILTIAQSFAGLAFLINMEFTWWEATAMFVLFVAQFVLPASAHEIVALIFFAWTGFEMIRFLIKRPAGNAFSGFRATWRAHVSG
jgi:cation:H+ antiporter